MTQTITSTPAAETQINPGKTLVEQARAAHAMLGSYQVCPIMFTLEVIRRKWAVSILYRLYMQDSPARFKNIERALAPITTKELSKRLRELESAGIVARKVYPQLPLRVEYQLTESGQSLMSLLRAMTEWGNGHLKNHPHAADELGINIVVLDAWE